MNVARALLLAASAALLALLAGDPAARAAEVKGVRQWTGQGEDAKPEKEWPSASPLTNKDDVAQLGKRWAGAKEVPEVDFDKEWVLVSTKQEGADPRRVTGRPEEGLRVAGVHRREAGHGVHLRFDGLQAGRRRRSTASP